MDVGNVFVENPPVISLPMAMVQRWCSLVAVCISERTRGRRQYSMVLAASVRLYLYLDPGREDVVDVHGVITREENLQIVSWSWVEGVSKPDRSSRQEIIGGVV